MIVTAAPLPRVRKPTHVTHYMPVHPLVRKFLEKLHGKELYHPTQDDYLGMWLINAFTRKTKQTKEITEDICKQKGYRDKFHFSVPIRYQDGKLMPARRVHQFNSMVLKFMDMELVINMEDLRRKGDLFYIQTAMNEFRDKYGIWDNEYKDERIRKMYYRFRQKAGNARSEFAEFLPSMLLGKF